ncbi:LAFA_0E14026g1_1 [Lachancea sp. 'fantastica']|nr:LAFA_0E14026g1_1 [Lachancea sp. 'fantastica']
MDLEYLEENFDPRGIKVAQLRRILQENDVVLSHGLKKAELCELFEQQIRPKRAELLRQNHGRDHKDDIERATTDSSFSRDVSEEESPFTNENDFQKKPKKSKKTNRKRKMEETDDVDAQDAPKPKKRGKSRLPTAVTDDESRNKPVTGSPLVDKVQSKSPIKSSPHKSLVIEKFESSSSSSPSSSPLPASSNAEIMDFSLQRRTASPDLSKLKISPEFREKLMKASSGSPSVASTTNRSAEVKTELSDTSFQDLPSFSSAQKRSSAQATPSKSSEDIKGDSGPVGSQSPPHDVSTDISEVTKKSRGASTERGKKEETPERSAQSSVEDHDVSTENETIASSEAEDNDESISLHTLEERVDETEAESELHRDSEAKESEEEKEAAETAVEDHTEEKEHQTPQTRKSSKFWKNARSGAKTLGSLLWKLVLNIMIILPILFGLWYREQRIQIGYCGHEVNLPTFENAHEAPWMSRVEEFLDQRKPPCLPCPENAICYPYMKIKCKPDYAVTKSKWSLQGLFPISDYCAKDSKREKLIAEVVQKSLELLRTKNGNVKCGESTDDLESGITEDDLYRIFYESRAPSINSEDFEDLWSQVVEDLKHEPDITWRQRHSLESDTAANTDVDTETDDVSEQEKYLQRGSSKNGIFRSTSKKYIGLRCKFEREVYQTYQRFKYVIWAVIGIVVLIKTVTHQLRAYFRRQEKIERLTQQVVAKLQKTAADSRNSASPATLSVVQLRDVLLSDVVDLKLKNDFWNSVVKKLESNNTNVRSSLMEVHGEIMKCWEWVGPVED